LNREMESQISELVGMTMECNKEAVQVAAVLGVAAIGCTALFVGGDVATTVMVTIAATLAGIVGWLFPSPLRKEEDSDD